MKLSEFPRANKLVRELERFADYESKLPDDVVFRVDDRAAFTLPRNIVLAAIAARKAEIAEGLRTAGVEVEE